MFTNPDEVLRYTSKVVTNDEIFMAQALIESYIGRAEANVSDPMDKENLSRAVAYQAVYMQDNWDTVFTQVDVASIASFNTSLTMRSDGASPYIASAAKFACRNLSWRGSKSVQVGSTWDRPSRYYDWTRDDN